ncbi:di-heme oxidoredictase family protein [Microbulbifer pacificus]|uniref:Di-heme oxidoredictase family protein n=1 Tax=Microbulbifer pacificus TaxID=407164 RepID=A0AAU0N3N2_9GAMM|nr:di-heme oxidoredictase family protein [Microbulbifer pacificus]WOX06883.1 di-heme oxidoredictase family protein [Microbulbifer pacificus]
MRLIPSLRGALLAPAISLISYSTFFSFSIDSQAQQNNLAAGARSIDEAIFWHGGEGQAASNAYQGLASSQKQDLLNFLNSL